MKKFIGIVATLYIICVVAVGCSDRRKPVEVVDLVSVFPGYLQLDSARQVQVLDSLRPEITALMQVVCADESVKVDPALIDEWCRYAAVQVFTPDVDSVFPDNRPVSEALGMIIDNADRNNVQLPGRRFVTVVWGRPQSMIFNDSILLIALNHYIGLDYPGYLSMPQYVRHYKSPEYIPYDLAEALLANAYPMRDDSNTTLLSRMLYEGALTYAKMKLVDKADLAHALYMLPPHLEWLQANERNVWQTLAAKKLLYDTNPIEIQKIVLPSPGATSIHPQAPGRTGRYIGYRIVEAYMKANPDTPISHLLSPDFYLGANTLSRAQYNPR